MSTNEISILLWLVAMTWVVRIDGTLDCQTACKKCKDKTQHSDLLEIYCAMCHECKNRRRHERLQFRESYEARRYPEEDSGQNDGEECPTPPPCDDYDELAPIPLKTTVDTTTTTTTTKRPCPQVPECKKRRHPKRMCCLPMCAYPATCPGVVSDQAPHPQPLTQAATRRPRARNSPPPQTSPSSPPLETTTNSDYYYVHVGVPKELV